MSRRYKAWSKRSSKQVIPQLNEEEAQLDSLQKHVRNCNCNSVNRTETNAYQRLAAPHALKGRAFLLWNINARGMCIGPLTKLVIFQQHHDSFIFSSVGLETKIVVASVPNVAGLHCNWTHDYHMFDGGGLLCQPAFIKHIIVFSILWYWRDSKGVWKLPVWSFSRNVLNPIHIVAGATTQKWMTIVNLLA